MGGSHRHGAASATRLGAMMLGFALAGCYDGLGSRPELGTGIASIGDDGIDDGADDGDDGGSENLEPAPGGVRRLLARQYVESVRHLLGEDAAAAAKPPVDEALGAFATIAAVEVAIGPVAVEHYAASATAVAKAAVASPGRLGEIAPCVVSGPQDDTCYVTLARELGHLAWRRPLEQVEIDELVAIATTARDVDGEFTKGVEWIVATLLQAVDFVYVVELGVENDDGTRELTGAELATRMSMVLVGRGPDAELLARAEAGELADADAIREVAAELVALPQARGPLVLFFDELLRLPDVGTRAKNPEMFPQFTPELAAAMREETLQLVEDVVFAGGDALDLFVAEHTFVDAQLAALYGIAAPAADGFARVELPVDQGRIGVLGHASFLANLSHPDRNSPTRRGAFVQKTLLCTEIPPPPADVDTELPPPVETETLRERLEVHMQNDACSGCHAQTDPIGFAFEHFDAIGAHRELEGTATIDSSGSIDGMGAFADAAELAWLLREDPRVPACLVRNLYRWAVGHTDDVGQADALAMLSDRFVADGHAFEALAVELVASPVFRRVGAPK